MRVLSFITATLFAAAGLVAAAPSPAPAPAAALAVRDAPSAPVQAFQTQVQQATTDLQGYVQKFQAAATAADIEASVIVDDINAVYAILSAIVATAKDVLAEAATGDIALLTPTVDALIQEVIALLQALVALTAAVGATVLALLNSPLSQLGLEIVALLEALGIFLTSDLINLLTPLLFSLGNLLGTVLSLIL